MQIMSNIRYVLNNENGGPNLEHLLGIAISSIFLVGMVRTVTKNTKMIPQNYIPAIASWDDSFN